jgi:hypothetical protein
MAVGNSPCAMRTSAAAVSTERLRYRRNAPSSVRRERQSVLVPTMRSPTPPSVAMIPVKSSPEGPPFTV